MALFSRHGADRQRKDDYSLCGASGDCLPDKNILTIEDPVEYELDGVGQMQVNPKINHTFADGLRGNCAPGPGCYFNREIRDGEAASIAVQSALTGHLVFPLCTPMTRLAP